jgi:hypothetical protein
MWSKQQRIKRLKRNGVLRMRRQALRLAHKRFGDYTPFEVTKSVLVKWFEDIKIKISADKKRNPKKYE